VAVPAGAATVVLRRSEQQARERLHVRRLLDDSLEAPAQGILVHVGLGCDDDRGVCRLAGLDLGRPRRRRNRRARCRRRTQATVSTTAVDNVGNETTRSCTTVVGYAGSEAPAVSISSAGDRTLADGCPGSGSCTTEVGYTKVITGAVKGKLVVKAGEAVELAATARASGTVTVKPGGALDVDGAALAGSLSASRGALVRICGAGVAGPVKATASSGAVIIGEGDAGCAASAFYGSVTVTNNTANVSIDGDVFHGSLKVKGNTAGTTVIDNTVAGALTVTATRGPSSTRPMKSKGARSCSRTRSAADVR
jgi:hypothetical protein